MLKHSKSTLAHGARQSHGPSSISHNLTSSFFRLHSHTLSVFSFCLFAAHGRPILRILTTLRLEKILSENSSASMYTVFRLSTDSVLFRLHFTSNCRRPYTPSRLFQLSNPFFKITLTVHHIQLGNLKTTIPQTPRTVLVYLLEMLGPQIIRTEMELLQGRVEVGVLVTEGMIQLSLCSM